MQVWLVSGLSLSEPRVGRLGSHPHPHRRKETGDGERVASGGVLHPELRVVLRGVSADL